MDWFQLTPDDRILTTASPTGQRQEAELGLYVANVKHSPKPIALAIGQTTVARWYDPAIGRFLQADTIVPNPASAKAFDRYAYALNNPVKNADPTGHMYCSWGGDGCLEYPISEDYDWLPGTWSYYGEGGNGTDLSSPPREYLFEDGNITLSPEELEELRSDLLNWIDVLDDVTDFQAGTEITTTLLDALGVLGEAGKIDPRLMVIQLFGWSAVNNTLDDLRDFTIALDDHRGTEVTIELGHNFRKWG